MRTADAITKLARVMCTACQRKAPAPIVVPLHAGDGETPATGRCSNRAACDRRLLRLKTLTHHREPKTT